MLRAAQAMNVVLNESIDRLNRAIEKSSASLNPEEAEQLREAARRSATALNSLRAKLSGQQDPSVDLADMAAVSRFPVLREPEARLLLRELDGIIADVEREVLVPAEKELSGDELTGLKRAIGEVWGWIVCDLQDPIWKQHPHAAPSSR